MAQQDTNRAGDRLINEAIKRILLDIVVRGHGDRLIGRWSREPELQQFLEQVPYLLDRISQLHLACTRTEHLEPGHIQHHYHKHHHHHHHHHQHSEDHHFNQTSLSDFINLIGADLHWLVRTRDALGLTPLHKAVLFNNRPIVEYILDRYPEELAPATWRRRKPATSDCAGQPPPSSTRLIDAQDKYGRTALHYAAAHLGQAGNKHSSGEVEKHYYTISHLHHFLVGKGASMRVPDFKGKTAPHYVRHPNELRIKSIIHLANKLNANYQANVLSKTLRASSHGVFSSAAPQDRPFLNQQEMVSLAECVVASDELADGNNRQSMSVSCNDLTNAPTADDKQVSKITRSLSTMHDPTVAGHEESERNEANGEPTTATTLETKAIAEAMKLTPSELNQLQRAESPTGSGSGSTTSFEHLSGQEEEQAVKQLRQERLGNNQILSQQDKIRVKRCLNEGVVDKINDLLVEGLANHLLRQANVSCWNQQCRRYINKVLPDKLNKLDQLHELIARNQLLAIKSLLRREPILARILRPYRRASMNALHLAVHLDRKVLVRYLADSFPELVQQRDSQGATCLHWAAKCLKHDRLYTWLLDRFGPQLEQLRDWRGKSAADYRQQALRLSTFSETHPAPKVNGLNARELLDQNQRLSNKLLSLSGSRAKLNEHTTRANKNKSPLRAQVASSPPSNSSLQLNDDSSESTTIGQGPAINSQEQVAKQQQSKPTNIRLHRLISSASTGSQPSCDTMLHRQRRLSESTLPMQHQQPLRKVEPLTTSCSSSRRQSCSDNDVFLSQFAELNLVDETTTTTTTTPPLATTETADSPLATPTLPTPIASSMARPESASSRRRLDLLIIDSIKAEDYKKLEHLILAGCGERLLRLYKSTSAPDTIMPVSARMQEFLDKSLPEYMAKIGKIYEVLHRCYGESKQAPITQTDSMKATRPDKSGANDDAANSMFHKLCNLLDRKRLIMSRDLYGACLLHVALVRSDARLVEYLLRRHPEAASAPDHESRTALHYAAIVLAAHNHHGTFKLTCVDNKQTNSDKNKSGSGTDERASSGFWLVDGQAKLTYDKLCSRYGELLEARDKRGLTCGQYLGRSQTAASHVNLTGFGHALQPSSMMQMVEGAKLFADCCSDYAQLLSRYNYCVLLHSAADDKPCKQLGADSSDKVHGQSSCTQVVQPTIVHHQQQQQRTTEAVDDTETTTAVKSLALDDDDIKSKQESSNFEANIGQITTPASQAMRSSTNGTQRRARTKPTSDDLLLDGRLIVSSSAADELAAPPPQSPTANQPVQVAPKPIVGSEHGYPLISHASPTVSGNNSGSHHHHHHHSSASLLGNHRRRRLLADAASDAVAASSSAQSPSSRRHRRHHHHQHHHHHHHHRHHHRHRSTINDSLVTKSLVGGVIVPTIIHNDKMDEIETYDIIYRQPPSMQSAISQESIAGLSLSSSSSSSLPNIGSPEKLQVEPRTDQPSSKLGESDSRSSNSSSSSSSSSNNNSSGNDDDDDDDDERVERLSDEFENRVRREKSELRAKVDQIMNEIKLSAKSDKSSRFLSSPLNNDQQQQQGCGGQGPSSSNQRVMFVMDGESNENGSDTSRSKAAAHQRHQSLSSSGPHSCSSSGSLSVSRTASASSCSTTSSSTFSISSSASSSSHSSKKQQSYKEEEEEKATGTIEAVPTKLQQQPATIHGDSQLASKNTYGQTYLHFIASRSQNAATFYKVLRHGNYLIGERDTFYRTARDVAIQFNLSNNVQILDKFLIDLFVEGKTQLLRHLLNQGYSPLIHVSDPDGNDIMLILKLLKLDRMIHFLLQMADFQRWRDELHTFIRNGYSGGVSELLRKHKDLVRAKSVHARTSLHLAVLFGRIGMVEELIEADPLSVQAIDNMGRSALHYTYGLQSMVNIELIRDKLLAAGARLDVRDVKMRTPKYYYIFKREIEEIKRIELELN